MNKEYSTSLDVTTQVLTSVAVIVLASAAAFSGWRLTLDETGILIAVHGSIVLLTISVLGGTWAFRVVGYTLDHESLIIHRPINNRRLALHDITKVVVPPSSKMTWSFRAFGNGGLFGFTGYYSNATFGMMRWYATRTTNYVVLILKDESKVVITPDDMGLASAIREQAGLPGV